MKRTNSFALRPLTDTGERLFRDLLDASAALWNVGNFQRLKRYDDEDAIGDFLDEANFQYAIGSVHNLEDVNVHYESYFADKPETERAALVEEYFENVVALIESELFEIAAHLDLIERNPALQGFATESHYRQVAEALERSCTVTELNAGRVLDDYGVYHPSPRFLDVLQEYDVSVTVGTDSHTPGALTDRIPHVADWFEKLGIEPAELSI